jgi:hypothetical protein
VVDFVAAINGLNLSPVLAFLLITLLASLKWIGKGILDRIESIEREVQRLRDEDLGRLHAYIQRHTTKIAIVETKLGMEENEGYMDEQR